MVFPIGEIRRPIVVAIAALPAGRSSYRGLTKRSANLSVGMGEPVEV
jgi:hypothetical protein